MNKPRKMAFWEKQNSLGVYLIRSWTASKYLHLLGLEWKLSVYVHRRQSVFVLVYEYVIRVVLLFFFKHFLVTVCTYSDSYAKLKHHTVAVTALTLWTGLITARWFCELEINETVSQAVLPTAAN